MENQIKSRWELSVNDIYFVDAFRKQVAFVFQNLGKSQSETVTVICREPEEMMLDINNVTHYRFRNGEFCYDIREDYRFTDNSVGSEHYYADFEARIEQASKTVMQVTGGGSCHTGSYASGSLRFEIESDKWSEFAENFVQKIAEELDKN
jgi:hypothetical protein